jgi:hypothetical protein
LILAVPCPTRGLRLANKVETLAVVPAYLY